MAEHVCPIWVGYLLANPLRKLIQNPDKILGRHVTEGMTVLDIGCAMGFFSLPLARMVGENGRVICVDVQERMIDSLLKRAGKAGLSGRIEARLCGGDSLGIDDLKANIDFACAIAVVHEVPDQERFFSEVFEAVKPGGRFLVAEPMMHVSESGVRDSISLAGQLGFKKIDEYKTMFDLGVLFER